MEYWAITSSVHHSMLIDSHCHLNHDQFADDLSQVIARAEVAEVRRMIVVGYDIPSSERAVRLAEQFAPVYAAVAVHPHDSKGYDVGAEARVRALATHPKVVSIGEIGLDYHYDFSPREAQFTAFRAQLALAREVGLPVIIHCREAYGDVLDVLEAGGVEGIGGVMHCWGGTQREAERALASGLHLGFGGTLTFKNAAPTREVARAVPLDRVLVETDAPYLAPVPYRGKRNEPAYTRLVVEKLAEIRGLPPDSIAAATTENVRRLFFRMDGEE